MIRAERFQYAPEIDSTAGFHSIFGKGRFCLKSDNCVASPSLVRKWTDAFAALEIESRQHDPDMKTKIMCNSISRESSTSVLFGRTLITPTTVTTRDIDISY